MCIQKSHRCLQHDSDVDYNAAVLAGPDLKNINIAGVQLSQREGPYNINGIVAIVDHYIV